MRVGRALYLPWFSQDLFYFYTPYRSTSEGVSYISFSKFQSLIICRFFKGYWWHTTQLWPIIHDDLYDPGLCIFFIKWGGTLLLYKQPDLAEFWVMCCMLSTFHVFMNWPTSVSRPLSLNSPLCLSGRKCSKKITSPIFRLLQNKLIGTHILCYLHMQRKIMIPMYGL